MKYYFIDLFCGAGGVTTGVEGARWGGMKCAEVIACINHDAVAIASHEANHPGVLHYTEDIRTLDLTELAELVRKVRLRNDGIICLWASLECTNFSKAKGGMPRDADSRTLAEHLYRYIEVLNPDMIWIENVEEFMSWGPLDEKGKPISRKRGSDYMKWVEGVKSYNYNFDFRICNAADYGAYTSRKRFFAQFAKAEIDICWPVATHSKKSTKDIFNSGMAKWKPVREVLNLETTGESIFIPGRIKSDKTFERIYHGLIKFVAGGKKDFEEMLRQTQHDSAQAEAFLMKFNSTASDGGVQHCNASIDNPAPTLDTQGRVRLINPVFLTKYYSGHPDSKNTGLDEPCGTIRTKDCIAFISAYYGNGHNCYGVDGAAPAVTTGDRFVLVSPQFIYRDFSNSGFAQGVDAPAGSMTNTPKLNLVSCETLRQTQGDSPLAFLMNTQFANVGSGLDVPSPTQTSNRKHFYLMNPQWFNTSNASVDEPCFTLIARQDKTPAYLVCAETGMVAIQITEDDLPHALLIKAFMVMYGIGDIKMRMLEIVELLRIQGFGDDYKLMGSKTKQKWMLGNAVEVNQAKVLIEGSFGGNVKEMQKVA